MTTFGISMFVLGVISGWMLTAAALLVAKRFPSGTATVHNVTSSPTMTHAEWLKMQPKRSQDYAARPAQPQ